MSEIWNTCLIDNRKFTTCRAFLNHLRELKITSKQYYDRYHKKDTEGICYCGKETKYHGFSYKKYCAASCAMRSLEHRKAVSERFINNPEALISFRSSRVGVDPNIEKRRKTIEDKANSLGMTVFEYHSQHSIQAHKNVSAETKTLAVLKGMKTKEENESYCDGRSFYRKVDFFGEQVNLQGYEPIVLNWLINEYNLGKFDINIGKSNIPIIKYGENAKQMYFPDFYLPKKNLLIEVKSTYTLFKHYENVMDKCQAAISSGYSILLLVLTHKEAKTHKLEGSKKLLDWAISSQAPYPFWYGEGSTTNLARDVETSVSKCNPALPNKADDIVWSTWKHVAVETQI